MRTTGFYESSRVENYKHDSTLFTIVFVNKSQIAEGRSDQNERGYRYSQCKRYRHGGLKNQNWHFNVMNELTLCGLRRKTLPKDKRYKNLEVIIRYQFNMEEFHELLWDPC